MNQALKADLEEDMDRRVEDVEAIHKVAATLMEKDPKLPFISAFVMASDMHQTERALNWLREGKHPWELVRVFCGSYGRLDLRVRAHSEGLITDAQVIADLPSEWSGSDPDDTDPRFLTLWKRAFAANGNHPLNDSETNSGTKKLPRAKVLTIYRGQDEGVPFGIAWSLDPLIARKFANGAATRQHARNGVVYAGAVNRSDVLGYMTGRGEAEVIVDPALVYDIEVWR